MLVVANSVMVVGKDSHKFDNGDIQYRVMMTNGMGDVVRVVVPSVQDWNTLVALNERYDVEIDVYASGYRTNCELVGYQLVKDAK